MSKGPDPRQKKRRARVKAAKRFAAIDAPCGICGGARGPIDYDAPRSHLFPLSLVIDEKIPVARWAEAGYRSAAECACDESNWQPAHWACNAIKSDGKNVKAISMLQAKRDQPSGTF